MQKDSNNTFVLSAGGKNYTIVMDETGGTQVKNLRGDLVPWQFIQVNNNVTVTETLRDSTIKATTVLIQTTKEGGAG